MATHVRFPLLLAFCVMICFMATAPRAAAQQMIVEDGQPLARIVTAEDGVPMIGLAARQLQRDVEAMTGAKLPIAHAPSDDGMVHIFVGRSEYTDQRSLDVNDLKHGGYHMVSGEGWLALLGRDQRFLDQRHETARELLRLARHRKGTPENDKLWEKWYEMSGGLWGLPYSQYWKMYNEELDISSVDERGTFNAVTAFLRMQGVRRYMPGELGLVMPEKSSIALPEVDKTVKPDMAVRYAYQHGRRMGGEDWDEILWQLWMGFNPAGDVMGIGYNMHGINAVTEVRTERGVFAHPRADENKPDEYYALFGGQRDIGGNQCLSSEKLFDANVRYIRAVFDILDAPRVSVNPGDSYTSICQCPKCKGKNDPSRPHRGQMSDYVWDYVNRVAKEVYKTHPDRMIGGLAYNNYRLPPKNVEQFSPNVDVSLVQHRRNFNHRPEDLQKRREVRQGFLDLLPGSGRRLMQDDHYRMTRGVPTYYMRAIADDFHSLNGITKGEFLDVERGSGRGPVAPVMGVRHLNLYLTGRYWWDNDQPLEPILAEYYDRFFGPASAEMKTFIEWSEQNWHGMTKSKEKIEKARALIKAAQAAVDADSIYGRRIALIAEFMKPLEYRGNQLANQRTNAPVQRIAKYDGQPLTIDGKLDEKFWTGMAGKFGGSLKEVQTGREPAFKTDFKIAYGQHNIYFAIRCQDVPGNPVNNTATKHDQDSIWMGDAVEILLETQVHSYYQLAISPEGALIDLSHEPTGLEFAWESNAQVATHIGDDYWTVEVRLPVAGRDRREVDPFDGLAGFKPSESYPWFFNICRQRTRGEHRLNMAFSPTNEGGFQHPGKFGKLIRR